MKNYVYVNPIPNTPIDLKTLPDKGNSWEILQQWSSVYLGKNKLWLNWRIDDLQLCKSTFLKILSITVPQMHFLVVYVPVICYAVWSLQMWSEHCLWWSEGPPCPLPLYETQNNECDPILHAAHAAPKTQDTGRKTQIHERDFFQENPTKLKYKKQRLALWG